MKLKYLAIAVAALAMTACSSNSTTDGNGTIDSTEEALAEQDIQSITDVDAASEAAVDQVVTAETTAAEGKEIILSDDAKYAPSKKVARTTILDFNATWCGPCKQFHPAFAEAAKKLGNQIDFVSVDIDNNPNTADAFGVQAIPTVIILTPQGEAERFVGTEDLLPAEKFLAIAQKYAK